MRSDLKKLESFTLETSKNHLIRNFLRNGRVRVNLQNKNLENEYKFILINIQFLSESLPIIEMLEECFPEKKSLFPKNPVDRHRARQICETVNCSMQPVQNLSVMRVSRLCYYINLSEFNF